jgi:UDP-N-acetylglucosamine 2-epimerase
MEKKILLIFGNYNLKAILNSTKNKNSLIIAGNDVIRPKINELGYNCKLISEYSKSPTDEINKSINWIKNWPDKPILYGKSFKDLLVYNGISTYWFLENRFYLYRIQNLIPLIEQIQNLISMEKPNQVLIHENYDVYHIIKEKYGDNIESIKHISTEKKQNRTSYKSYSGNRLLKLFALKSLRGFGKISKEDFQSVAPILIITEMAYWRPAYDFEKQKIIHKDTFFHDIIKELKLNNLPFRMIDFENNPKRLLKSNFITKERQKEYGSSVEPWEKYITLQIIKKTIKFNQELNQIWNKISTTKEFKKSLSYEDISLYDILKNDIESLLKSFKSYMAVTFIETAKNILDIIKPSLILMHDEYGTLQLSMIKEAKKRNIPTVSIQHGANTESSISYIHLKNHVKDEIDNLIFPIPQKMCVWSEKSKKNLLDLGNFPIDVPIVTGDPKIDFLPNVINQFNYQEICDRLKIPNEKKIIVFATQPLSNLQEKELITKAVFKSLNDLENAFLLVKAHPNETNLTFYHEIAKKYAVKNYSVEQFFNLYEILYISDVLVNAFSTVGIEAMRMKKPVISIDLLGLHENDPLIRSKNSFIVHSENQLTPFIKQCFEIKDDEQMINDRVTFAQKEIGKMDGQASKRIVNVIKELLKKNDLS